MASRCVHSVSHSTLMYTNMRIIETCGHRAGRDSSWNSRLSVIILVPRAHRLHPESARRSRTDQLTVSEPRRLLCCAASQWKRWKWRRFPSVYKKTTGRVWAEGGGMPRKRAGSGKVQSEKPLNRASSTETSVSESSIPSIKYKITYQSAMHVVKWHI